MAMSMIASKTDVVIGACSVKNTFIDFHREREVGARRNKSLPPSFKASEHQVVSDTSSEDDACSNDFKSTTVASTTRSADSDVRTEASDDDSYQASVAAGWNYNGELDSPFFQPSQPSTFDMVDMVDVGGIICEPCASIGYPMMEVGYENVWNQMPYGDTYPVEEPFGNSVGWVEESKLNTKAAPFCPLKPVTLEEMESKGEIREMVDAARVILEESLNIKGVEAIEEGHGWSLAIAPVAENARFDEVLEQAKAALLKAAENSSNAYVVGYSSPEIAFVRKGHGFECQLAIMAKKRYACWQYFSEGSCKYKDCRKDHPTLQVPLQVNVEITSFNAPAHLVQHFKEEVAQLLMTVTAILMNTIGVVDTDAFHEDQGCCIEVFVQDFAQKEHVLNTVKNTVSELTQISTFIYAAVASAPYFAKSQGFAFILADKPDQSQACWDHCMYGVCRREHGCRWRHAQCSVPVNIVVKAAETVV